MADDINFGLLSDALGDPLLNLGLGILAASGPSAAPVSTGQAIGAGVGQANRAVQLSQQNQLVRDRIVDNQRKREAQAKLKELLPGELSLLADIAPDQVAQGLVSRAFPSERTAPPELRLLEAMGIDPRSPEGQEILLSKLQGGSTRDILNQLQVRGLLNEEVAQRVALEDTAISANAGINALETIKAIPGADIFLTNPDLIHTTRQALAVGELDPTGILKGLPSKVSGIPQDQLSTALNAAETVEKQRNALGQGLSTQAGAAGLRSRLLSLGQGAGLDVQLEVFGQALDRAKRQLAGTSSAIDVQGFGDKGTDAKSHAKPPPTARQIAARRTKKPAEQSTEIGLRTAGGMIPPAAVRFLKDNADDPAVREQFRSKYGHDPEAFLR
ncbi:hypothetical protein [Methyloceanibacter caenitepidi]|uniref:Uncharacterized protein n=1 Tax=Methyloceanibacter caenitepidi TaxID=1384459 RepID=A0A0A8K1Y8_9HYPH|nr:hypothetical protein [Methyloceanibacter caenitepidi]BAQ16905.1 hypothetical protein GL4_1449 [Methyloceanibacter caenitepidi]